MVFEAYLSDSWNGRKDGREGGSKEGERKGGVEEKRKGEKDDQNNRPKAWPH